MGDDTVKSEAEIRKEELAALRKARDFSRKPCLTLPQRMVLLNQAYDGAAVWLQQAVVSGWPGGTGAATMVMERTRLEMIELQRADLSKERTPHIMTYEYDYPEARQTEA